MIVTKEQVEQAFRVGGFTINERFEECGFIYFPTSEPPTKENPDQGRVFFNFEPHEYPDTDEGAFEKRMDAVMGSCRDTVTVSPSWDRATDRQMEQIYTLLTRWVTFTRQQRGTWNYSLADKAQMQEEAEVAEEEAAV